MSVDQSDAYPFLGPSADLMKQALDRNLPTLGVCLVSQMMARVLGAEVHRAEYRNATFSSLRLTPEGLDDPVISSFGSGKQVLQFHEDIFELPDGVVLLATSNSSGLNQAFRYGDLAYSVQFHFEVDRAIIESWCDRIGLEEMIRAWGISKKNLTAQADHFLAAQKTAGGRGLLQRFLELSGY